MCKSSARLIIETFNNLMRISFDDPGICSVCKPLNIGYQLLKFQGGNLSGIRSNCTMTNLANEL